MRTRNQSKQIQSTGEQKGRSKKKAHTSEIVEDSGVPAVGKQLKKPKKGLDKDVGCLRHCDSETMGERVSSATENTSMGRVELESCGEDARCTSVKVEAEVTVSHHSNHDDDNDSDWEDGTIPTLSPTKDNQTFSTDGVSIEFDVSPGSAKRKPFRRATAEEKEIAECIHKVHLLCLIGRGRLIDGACDDALIQASLLSLLPSHLLKIGDLPNLTASHLSPLVSWFHKNFRVRSPSIDEQSCQLLLATALETREGTPEAVAALSVALFRALNLTSRFISVLDVVSLKPNDGSTKDIFNSSTLMVTGPTCASAKSSVEPKQSDNLAAVKAAGKQVWEKSMTSESQIQQSTVTDKSKHKMLNDISESYTPESAKSKRKGDLEFQMQLEMALSSTALEGSKNSMASNVVDSPSTSTPVRPFKRMKKIRMEETQSSSGGVSVAIGSQKVGAPLYWAEIFCSGENLTGKWVHVDAVNAIIDGEHKVEDAVAACKRSLRYAVAFAGSGAKDVTRRYCTKWHKVDSQRINSAWWDTVLAPLKELESRATSCIVTETSMRNSLSSTRSSLEDMELATRSLTEPLPTNQQAYKNHHLYVIERWLKKYEILYPKGPVLGYCSGHAVYPRTCVKILHTKERWLREGLQLKADELPVKVLKRSLKQTKEEDDEFADGEREQSTPLYGKWQTEPLRLTPAVNGIVPRNERGQVDVWSEKCLPPGTVHLPLPRLVPIAEKLGINFAPAMVGFEFKSGRSHPVYDGIVVCEEFKNAILEAYAEEEERREVEEKKRNELQALSRWYQLLSSIITRQRLKNSYGDPSSSQFSIDASKEDDKHSKSAKKTKASPRIQRVNSPKTVSDFSVYVPDENHEHEFVLDQQDHSEEGSTRVKRCDCGFSIQFEEL